MSTEAMKLALEDALVIFGPEPGDEHVAPQWAARAIAALAAPAVQTGPCTPAHRFEWLMRELEARFPHPNPLDSTKTPECYALEAIDALRGALHAPTVPAPETRKPVTWIAEWAYESMSSGQGGKGSVMHWTEPKDRTGLVPLFGGPSAAPGPLTDAQIESRWESLGNGRTAMTLDDAFWDGVKYAEIAHGIRAAAGGERKS